MWGDCDPRNGRPFFDHGGETNAGWVNAVRDVDGWGALVASNGNLIKASAELWAFPPRPLQDQVSYELALHLALVGTF